MSPMMYPLRHSHIALRRSLSSLAKAVGADVASGDDDLGHYRFFDLVISHQNGPTQRVRFASHEGDEMAHLLAERIDEVSDLAAALYSVGIGPRSELSISIDRNGMPLRDQKEITDRIAAMSKSSDFEVQKDAKKGSGRPHSVWKGPFVDGYLLKNADKVRGSGREQVIKMWSRRSTILPQFVGLTFGVYNGQKHIPVNVTEEMVGHKFGEYAPAKRENTKPLNHKKVGKK